MCKLKHVLFCVVIAIFCAKFANAFTASDEQQNQFQKSLVLTASDFDNIVYESANAWIVAYYDGQHEGFPGFSESWDSLAEEIADREDVKIGAVNCGKENLFCRNQGIENFPTVKFYEENSKPEATGVDFVNLTNANLIKHELIHHLKKQASRNPTLDTSKSSPNKISKRQTETSNATHPAFIDKVYQEDVEYAIWYSVNREVLLGRRVLEGEKLESLRNYLDFLSIYGPLGQYKTNGSLFLKTISQKLQENTTVFARDYRRLLNSTFHELTPVYSSNLSSFRWLGCYSSEERFRGYPCALWTIFHVLTVNYAISENNNEDSAKALHMVSDYVKNFFLCLECQEHFAKMVERNRMNEVKDRNEAVLWLWRAHNEVNERLVNDVWNMDAKFPKIQYPSKENCPSCRDESGGWNEDEVLKYLKKKYGSEGFGAGGANVISGRFSLVVLLTVFLLSKLQLFCVF